ncbi:hypothetical protein AB0N89_34460 [Amycolatopsis sp. NPDC089917]|uniref:hypothetical protein n=1 Tax=Amycolatopsis sp. NPDC089917 TaxID=3155187 RepID=UPI00342741CA
MGSIPPTEELLHKIRNRGETILRDATDAAGPATGTNLSETSAAPALIAASGHSRFTAMFGGSVTTALAGHSRCPVVSVRGRTWDLPIAAKLPVVTGVDGSPGPRSRSLPRSTRPAPGVRN